MCSTAAKHCKVSKDSELEATHAEGARDGEPLPTFHPEFGRFMLEATPGKPWGIGFKDLLDVETNMKWRCVFLWT